MTKLETICEWVGCYILFPAVIVLLIALPISIIVSAR